MPDARATSVKNRSWGVAGAGWGWERGLCRSQKLRAPVHLNKHFSGKNYFSSNLKCQNRSVKCLSIIEFIKRAHKWKQPDKWSLNSAVLSLGVRLGRTFGIPPWLWHKKAWIQSVNMCLNSKVMIASTNAWISNCKRHRTNERLWVQHQYVFLFLSRSFKRPKRVYPKAKQGTGYNRVSRLALIKIINAFISSAEMSIIKIFRWSMLFWASQES